MGSHAGAARFSFSVFAGLFNAYLAGIVALY
jgi:hypothetical protein